MSAPAYRRGPYKKPEGKKTVLVRFYLSPFEKLTLDTIARKLECNQSEALRRAIAVLEALVALQVA